MAKKKQSVGEKIAEVVDHVLHPSQESGPEKVESPAEEESSENSSEESVKVESPAEVADDLAKHPKFDKFKTTGEI